MSRFDYVKYDAKATKCSLDYKSLFMDLEDRIEIAIRCSDTEQEKDYWKDALRHAEISYAMIGKALRDYQVHENGSAELQEERGNE